MRQTLKAQILTLWCRGRSYDEIVAELGCSRDYVRASVSRARYGGKTPGDLASERRVLERYHTDPEYRRMRDAKHAEYVRANRERVNATQRARNRERYRTDPEYRERVLKRMRDREREQRMKAAQNDGAPLRGGAGRL
jgi:hypothetical protein